MPRKPSPVASRQPFGRRACGACRASKTKCDRRPCCVRCQEKHLDCSYDYNSESTAQKSTLREEIRRRKEPLDDANTILDALRDKAGTGPARGRPNDTTLEIIRRLSRGDSRKSIVKRLNDVEEKNLAVRYSLSQDPAAPASNASSTPTSIDVDSSSPLEQRVSNASRHQPLFTGGTVSSDSPPSQSTQGSTSSISPPVGPFSISAASSPTTNLSVMSDGEPQRRPSEVTIHDLPRDNWTSSGCSKRQVLGLIIPILDWDGVPLCVIRKELFLEDFDSGARQYCSPALVSALLALALTVIPREQQQQQQKQHTPDGDDIPDLVSLDSDAMAQESCSQVRSGGTVLCILPDSQAIGVLALREASLGRGSGLAGRQIDEFAVAMANVCFGAHETVADGSEYAQVRAMTYRGAVTLRRICQLTGVTASSSTLAEAHYVPFLEISKSNSNLAELADACSSHVSGYANSATTQGGASRPRGPLTAPPMPPLAVPRIRYSNVANINAGAVHPQNFHRNYPHYLISALFQLAGCLQKHQIQEHISTPVSSVRVQLYFNCLEWYNGFFAIQLWHRTDLKEAGSHTSYDELSNDKDRTQDLNFEIFTHMFYHFCILQTLSPLASGRSSRVGNMLASDICRSAAETVRALAFPTAGGSDVHGESRQSLGQLTSKFVSAADSFLARPFFDTGVSAR